MVLSMNQTDLVCEEYLLSGNIPRSILTRDGSIYGPFHDPNRASECGSPTHWQYSLVYFDPGWSLWWIKQIWWVWPCYSLVIFLGLFWSAMEISVMIPSMNQTDLVSVALLLSGNILRSTLIWDGNICYGNFDDPNRFSECGLPTFWQYSLVSSDQGWYYLLWFLRWN